MTRNVMQKITLAQMAVRNSFLIDFYQMVFLSDQGDHCKRTKAKQGNQTVRFNVET